MAAEDGDPGFSGLGSRLAPASSSWSMISSLASLGLSGQCGSGMLVVAGSHCRSLVLATERWVFTWHCSFFMSFQPGPTSDDCPDLFPGVFPQDTPSFLVSPSGDSLLAFLSMAQCCCEQIPQLASAT